MTIRRRRKCRHCGQLFRPDPRNLRHQRYCSAKECRRASKAASQRRWLAKAENRDYFSGPGQVARVSEAAQAKARSKRTADGAPVHSLRTLLNDLATVTRNTVAPRLPGTEPFEVITRPTPLQDKALKLLGVRLLCSQ